jgi:hypothetical protein
MDLHGTPPAFITACTAGANRSSAPARMGIGIIVRTPWSLLWAAAVLVFVQISQSQ